MTKCKTLPVTLFTDTIACSYTPKRRYIHQNFRLIWLDANLDKDSEDVQNSMYHLCHIIDVDSIVKCVDVDECVKWLKSFKTKEVFMIVSGSLGQSIMRLSSKFEQLVSVFVFCGNKSYHQDWVQEFKKKVNGIYTDIVSISKELRLLVLKYYKNWIPISVLSQSLASKPNLKEMDASFMCTQLFKENILQDVENEVEACQTFTRYCRDDLGIDEDKIKEFEKNYRRSTPISCYTSDNLIQSLLNWALHINEVSAILKMRFFINALHCAIEEQQAEQLDYKGRFTVYQHHELSIEDFHILENAEGGLISFNSFLSAGPNRKAYKKIAWNSNLVSILFSLTIDPMISSSPYATLDSKLTDRPETVILFSSHTIFRINEVKKTNKGPIQWEVSLSLTSRDDKDLAALNTLLRDETRGFTKWNRLSELLLKFRAFDKAEELCQTFCDQKSDNSTKVTFYHQLGQIRYHKGDYLKAIDFYQKAIEICQSSSSNSFSLAESYMGIGSVYQRIGGHPYSRQDCNKAIQYYQDALAIFERCSPSNDLILANLHSRIGDVYQMMPENVNKAKESYEKALAIRLPALAPDHPKVAESYNKIGRWYERVSQHKDALLYYEKALEILKKAQPPMYPELVINYKMIGELYQSMNQKAEADSNFLEATKIAKKYLHSDD